MIRTLFAAVRRDAADIIAAVKDVCRATEKDPKRWAETPPLGWHKATPEAPVPPRKTKAVDVDFDVYTLAEIEAMTDDEYRIKVGSLGIGTRAEMIKLLTKKERKKPERGNAIEL